MIFKILKWIVKELLKRFGEKTLREIALHMLPVAGQIISIVEKMVDAKDVLKFLAKHL